MDNLNSYRTRAVKAILQKLDSVDSSLQTWDYKLDDVAREVFNLPARPEGSKPYFGWLKLGSNYQKNCVLTKTITRNCKLEEVEATGKLPEYKADSGSSKKNNSGSYKTSPADKVTWLKKELVSSIKDGGYNEDMSLIDLVDQIVSESEDENTLAIYTDLLKATLN